jgi:hypothetical protein
VISGADEKGEKIVAGMVEVGTSLLVASKHVLDGLQSAVMSVFNEVESYLWGILL